MKHIKHVSIDQAVPAEASLIVWQQKATVLTAFAASATAWGNALGVWLGLQEDKSPG